MRRERAVMPGPVNSAARLRALATLLCVLLLPLAAVAGDDPTPTPQPKATPTPGPKSLADLARDLKLNTEGPEGKGIVISNSSLASSADDAKNAGNTTRKPAAKPELRSARPAQGRSDGITGASSAEQAKEQGKRDYWRGKYERQLQMVEGLKQKIRELDLEIPGLWNKFYAWDDPAYRDGVIKVRLDEALGEREQYVAQLATEQARVDEIKVEARRDGALPGWFRGLPTPTP